MKSRVSFNLAFKPLCVSSIIYPLIAISRIKNPTLTTVIDIALATNADGIHLGQDDLDLKYCL